MLASTNTNFLQMYETMDGQPQVTSDCSQTLYSTGFFVQPAPVLHSYWQDEQTGYFYPVLQDSTSYGCSYPIMEQVDPIQCQAEQFSIHLEPIQYPLEHFSTQYQGQCYLEPIQFQVEPQLVYQGVAESVEYHQAKENEQQLEEFSYGFIGQVREQQGTQQWTEQLAMDNFSNLPPQQVESAALDSKDDVAEQQSTVETSEDKENEKPPGYKTRLCTHFSSGRKCPKGPHCHFAHGPEELRRGPSPAQRPAKDPRRKTMICRNLATCSLGVRCRFLHPEDGSAYLKVVDFEEMKEAHSKKVQALHTLKKQHPESSQKANAVEDEINKTVREYNGTNPRGDHYYDLHGMTTNGAKEYVEEIVVEMKKEQVERAWFETGRGNHSKWNFPAIKRLLIDKYSGSNDICISCDQLNPGILVLTIL